MGSGWTIINNTFDSVMDGIFIGGGRQNTVQRNMFINCSTAAVHIDPKGLQARPNGMPQYCNASEPYKGLFLQELDRLNFSTPGSRWHTAYAHVFNLTMSCAPAYNRVTENVWCKDSSVHGNTSEFTDFDLYRLR